MATVLRANLAKPDSQKDSRSVLLVAVGEHKDVKPRRE